MARRATQCATPASSTKDSPELAEIILNLITCAVGHSLMPELQVILTVTQADAWRRFLKCC